MSDALPWEPRSLAQLAAWFDRLNELEDAESHPLDITDHLNRLVPILTLLVGDYELVGLDPSDVKAQAYRYKHYARWPNWKRLEIVEEHIGPLGDRLEDAVRFLALLDASAEEETPATSDQQQSSAADQQAAIPAMLHGKTANARVANLYVTTPESTGWRAKQVGHAIGAKAEAVRQTAAWKANQRRIKGNRDSMPRKRET